MEIQENSTQPKPRKKRKLQEPPVDLKCPYPDPISHAEAARILGLSVYDASILCKRRGISHHYSARYISRSKREVLEKGFIWKYKDKAYCIDFDWAKRILGMPDAEMEEEIHWKLMYDKRYCTATAIMNTLYEKS